MDTWDPLRGCSSPEEAFGGIRARLSFVGISSDWLFPPQTVRDFAYTIRAAGVAGRLPGDDQRPRPRRLSGRAGGTGAAAAMTGTGIRD